MTVSGADRNNEKTGVWSTDPETGVLREETYGDFPFGDLFPEGGFQVGDKVGLIYSDHEHYVFDNPVGVVTAVSDGDDEDFVLITVQVEAQVQQSMVFLLPGGREV